MRLPRPRRLALIVEHRRLHDERLDTIAAADLHRPAPEVQVNAPFAPVVLVQRPLLDHLDVAGDRLVVRDRALARGIVDLAALGHEHLRLLELAELAKLLGRPGGLRRAASADEVDLADARPS